MKVGFIGLGIMGAPMAANLVKAGFEVGVYNRTPDKCESLVAAGAQAFDSPRAAAVGRDAVFTIVSDTPDVEAVLFNNNGVAAGASAGTVVIDMSTISPTQTVAFAKRLAQQDITMLDAPVSGGESGAREGRLSIMVGGERAAFDRCLPLFHAMGKTIIYTGESGNGQRTKLVNQIVGSLNLLAAVEGLRVASAAGLDLATTLDAIGGGAAGSWMWSNLGPKIAAGDDRPGFSIYLHAKDLRLASEFLDDLNLEAPGTRLTSSLFRQAEDTGLGALGNQGLARLWREQQV